MYLNELLTTLETPIILRPTRRMTQSELEGYLEKAANILRGNTDHSEFRGYVFALLFYKRINDCYEEEVRTQSDTLIKAGVPQEQALQLALSILPQGGILDLLHVVEDVIPPTYFAAEGETIFDIMPQVKIKTKDSLQKVADKLVPENVQRNLIIREGKVAATIIDVAKERKSDIIVMGTHSMNALAQILIGSQANKVIRKAHCPVLTTK